MKKIINNLANPILVQAINDNLEYDTPFKAATHLLEEVPTSQIEQMVELLMESIYELNEENKHLQHHKDTTIGLWATDKPEDIIDTKNYLFEIK